MGGKEEGGRERGGWEGKRRGGGKGRRGLRDMEPTSKKEDEEGTGRRGRGAEEWCKDLCSCKNSLKYGLLILFACLMLFACESSRACQLIIINENDDDDVSNFA